MIFHNKMIYRTLSRIWHLILRKNPRRPEIVNNSTFSQYGVAYDLLSPEGSRAPNATFWITLGRNKIPCAILYLLLLFSYTTSSKLQAETCGKFDLGPAYLHIDVLESGHTVQKINMPGLRGDSTILLWQGVCLKPFFTYGGKGNSQVFSGGCGIGHYTPIGDKCSVTPSIGCGYTYFRTHFHLRTSPTTSLVLKEIFQSVSPYVSLDGSYCFYKGWRLIASYQYVWSFTHTTIKGLGTTDSKPKGSNYGLMVEWDANERWSLNLGAGYNVSLTKEKHGLRGFGARLGFAYWF